MITIPLKFGISQSWWSYWSQFHCWLLFIVGTSLISWCNKKNSVVAHSSIETEWWAIVEYMSKLLWLQWLLANMRDPQTISPLQQLECYPRCPKQCLPWVLPRPSTLRSIVTLSNLISSKVAFTCTHFPLKANLLTCSLSPIHKAIFLISSSNSSWLPLCHIEFEGDVSISNIMHMLYTAHLAHVAYLG